jgi:hypothetical protein
MQTTKPISLAGSQVDPVRHVRALFHNDDEEYRMLVLFIKDLFKRGDNRIVQDCKVVYPRGVNSAGYFVVNFRHGTAPTILPGSPLIGRRIEPWVARREDGGKRFCRPADRRCSEGQWAYYRQRIGQALREYAIQEESGMKRRRAPVSLAGSHLSESRHAYGSLRQNPFFLPLYEFLQEFRQRRVSRNRPHATD